MRFAVQQARADQRFSAYAGWGAPQPGRYADAAMAALEAAAEAAASGGMGVKYAWPADAPVVLSPYLEIGGLACTGCGRVWCRGSWLKDMPSRGGWSPHKLFWQSLALTPAACCLGVAQTG
jgi:hypothetical protein